MNDIVNQFHQDFRETLLRLDAGERKAVEWQRELERMNFEAGCRIGGNKAVPCYLLPYVMSGAMEARVRRLTEQIMNALEKATELYFAGPEYRHLFELSADEAMLAEIDPGYTRKIILARLDAFIIGERIVFIEFNCDSPGGMDTDLMASNLLAVSPFRELAERYEARWVDLRPRLLDTLVRKYFDGGGKKDKPDIALLADAHGHTFPEFIMLVSYFNQQGFRTKFGNPWEVEYRDGVLYREEQPVDLVYRRGAIGDWTGNLERIQPLVNAYRDGAVTVVNPLRSKVGGMKSMLSVLTDEKMQHLFNEEEQAAIRETIPWTRFVRPGETSYNGTVISLLDFIAANREKLVLKPNSAYGGRDVAIGPELSQKEWEDVLALTSTGRWVVQEYVPIPTIELPVFGPELTFARKKVNVNFFAFNGHYAGAYARTSDSSVINVARGGGQMPVFTLP
ncbi:circularly permuted type 2 ATP-grasp protein [bacterium]|nr:circularly permuted type 2 ATP-grasp protein [candidate division CSSED10-310 bacterium]